MIPFVDKSSLLFETEKAWAYRSRFFCYVKYSFFLLFVRGLLFFHRLFCQEMHADMMDEGHDTREDEADIEVDASRDDHGGVE